MIAVHVYTTENMLAVSIFVAYLCFIDSPLNLRYSLLVVHPLALQLDHIVRHFNRMTSIDVESVARIESGFCT